jgi:predicted nucleic acid-binding protein
MAARIYIETTIFGYLAARPTRDIITLAHQEITRQWWQASRSRYEIYISQAVLDEARGGDHNAATRRSAFLSSIPLLELNDLSRELTRALITSGAVPGVAVVDALHVAVATAHGMDYLLTWNCRHIANATMRGKMTRVALEHGLALPVICTPEELMDGE